MIFPSLIIRIERWKFNKDYGVYVSTQGNFKDRYKRRLPIKINNGGYCCVKTEKGIKLSHRLVMLTWCPIPDAEVLTIDHLNHNKRDNSLENLEWVTQEENLQRANKDYILKKDLPSFHCENDNLKYSYVIDGIKFYTLEEALEWIRENPSKEASIAFNSGKTTFEQVEAKNKDIINKREQNYSLGTRGANAYGFYINVVKER